MARVTADQAIAALTNAHGLISVAARQLGTSRKTLHQMINTMPTVKEARDDAREALKDFAESKIYEEIKAGNTVMLIFYAKTQMKDRGYVERQEHTGADGGTIKLDLSSLTDEQLQRILAGDDPAAVITSPNPGGG